jgi:hypothetical protein
MNGAGPMQQLNPAVLQQEREPQPQPPPLNLTHLLEIFCMTRADFEQSLNFIHQANI